LCDSFGKRDSTKAGHVDARLCQGLDSSCRLTEPSVDTTASTVLGSFPQVSPLAAVAGFGVDLVLRLPEIDSRHH